MDPLAIDYGALSYRTGARLARALVDGEDAFVFAAETSPDFDPEVFARFARGHNLREWLTPLAAHPRGRALLGESFAGVLDQRAAALPAERRALLAMTGDIARKYGEAGIPCVFFKGLYLAEHFYGDLHRRHQYDLDVLVPEPDFERALALLEPLGFDPRVTSSGRPAARRLAKIRNRRASDGPHTVTLQREDRLEVDLHCRLKSRFFHGLDQQAIWNELQTVRVGGLEIQTLSDERTLAHLLASIAADLRRAAARAKHFLDLYMVLRALDPTLDWESFFERRAEERTERVSVNVLAVFLTLWDVADEFPALARALERRLGMVELRDAREADAIVTRRRRDRRNRLWFVRLRAGGRPWFFWGLRATVDLPRVVRRRSTPPWRAAPAVDPGATAGLPAPLRALIAREGLRVAEARAITTLPATRSPRGSWRIVLADGRVVKGRVFARRARVAARRRWSPRLPPRHFPPLLAALGSATLEAWVPGTPCEKADHALLAGAGSVLGKLHAVVPRERLAAGAGPLVRWQRDAEAWIDELRTGGFLDAQRASRVHARTRALRPDRATFGLQHGDFCLENLVRAGGSLVCVDNPTIRPDVQESDLAQTFYRWPMLPGGRDAFLDGYREHADPAAFLAHEDYWMIAAALRAAAFRLREGTGGVEVPLALLDRHLE